MLGDSDRARAIYQLAIQQNTLDMPEVLWKAYIDFEIQQEEYENARRLYHRLLQRTHHVKVRELTNSSQSSYIQYSQPFTIQFDTFQVWISFAQFELLVTENEERNSAARDIFKRANRALRTSAEKEERLMLLEAWKKFEVIKIQIK